MKLMKSYLISKKELCMTNLDIVVLMAILVILVDLVVSMAVSLSLLIMSVALFWRHWLLLEGVFMVGILSLKGDRKSRWELWGKDSC